MANTLKWVVLLVLAEAGTNLACDGGWVGQWSGEPDNCYLFVNTTRLSWYQAAKACQAQGASLVYIDTQQELDWLKTQLSAHGSYAYWTGLNLPAYSIGLLLQNFQWTWGQHRAVNRTLLNTFWSTSPAGTASPMCAGVNVQGRFEDLDCDSQQRYACSFKWAGDGQCPQYWYVTERGCVWLSEPSEPLLTWAQAKDRCFQMDRGDAAHLLTLTSPGDVSFLSRLLHTLNATTHVFWTSLVVRDYNILWDNGDAFDPSLIQWAVEPDHVAGQENCGALRLNGKFSDRNCSMPLNYICKK